MQTILFFSYKGGVGRSLTLCNTAAALYRRGYKVGIVDFDVEAPSIHIQMRELLPKGWNWNNYTPDILTLLRNDIEELSPLGIQEATLSLHLQENGELCGEVIPCFGREHDLTVLEKEWPEKPNTLNKIFKMFGNNSQLDFLLLDARSGFAQQSVLAALFADQVVALTRADHISLMGMKMMLNLFKHRPIDKIHLILTSVPDGIEKSDQRLKDFTKELEYKGRPLIMQYIPEWYFGGEIIWKPTAGARSLVKPFNALAKKLIGD